MHSRMYELISKVTAPHDFKTKLGLICDRLDALLSSEPKDIGELQKAMWKQMKPLSVAFFRQYWSKIRPEPMINV